ncbi:hypothetical protein AAFA46_00570 [Oscillospiraceae bacterium WX1]
MTREEWLNDKHFDELSREMNGETGKFNYQMLDDRGGFLSVKELSAEQMINEKTGSHELQAH